MFSISTQDYVLGYSQPSLRDSFVFSISTQDCVLGYSQPSPFDKLRAGFSGLISELAGQMYGLRLVHLACLRGYLLARLPVKPRRESRQFVAPTPSDR